MPGQRGTERRRLDGAPVMVRLDHDLRSRVDAAAEANGLSAASWLRDLADRNAPGTGGEVRRTPPRRPLPPPPPAWLKRVDGLREVVGEAGGELTRLSKTARLEGFAAIHAALEALIPDIKDAGKRLVALVERGRFDGAGDHEDGGET